VSSDATARRSRGGLADEQLAAFVFKTLADAVRREAELVRVYSGTCPTTAGVRRDEEETERVGRSSSRGRRKS